jgi:hypothetical protein
VHWPVGGRIAPALAHSAEQKPSNSIRLSQRHPGCRQWSFIYRSARGYLARVAARELSERSFKLRASHLAIRRRRAIRIEHGL